MSSMTSRGSKRFEAELPAVFDTGSERTEGFVRQISEGGLLFQSAARLGVGSTGLVSVGVFEGEPPVAIRAKVIYELPGPSAGQGGRYRFGLKFMDTGGTGRDEAAKIIGYLEMKARG